MNSDHQAISALEMYRSDLQLEEAIQAILQDQTTSKKEKTRLLRQLQAHSPDSHLRSHVQYYLNSIQINIKSLIYWLLSILSISLFGIYTIYRLFGNL